MSRVLDSARWTRRIGPLFCAVAFLVAPPAPAWAQSAASAYTAGTRYNLDGQVTGTIAPDPDGSGPLHYAAVRTTYNAAAWATKVETGELAAWQSEAVAPSAWTGFTVSQTIDTAYDADGRKVRESLSSGSTTYAVTQYSYNVLGLVECTAVRMNPAVFGSLPSSACTLGTTGSQGADRITRNVYYQSGRIQKIQKAYGTPRQQDYAAYTYNANGKVETMTDANGQTASMTYDGLGRQTKWNLPDKLVGGTASTTDFEAYEYDANDNRTKLTKRDGSIINYSYDALNRMTLKDIPGGTAADVYYGYDLRGLQLYARFVSASGAGITSTYDALGQETSSSTNMSGTAKTLSYQWDANENRTRITHADGNYFTYDYDGLDRAVAIKQNGSTTIVADTYDAQGHRSSETRGPVTTTYTYDPMSRLASLSDDLASTANDVTNSFTYNPASQVVGKARSNDTYAFNAYPGSPISRNYAVNGINQYGTAGSASFTYDANGNLTGDGTVTYTYDVENRMLTASGPTAATLSYDPLGRLWRIVMASGTVDLAYDGDAMVRLDAGTALNRYIHGNGEDDPLIWYRGTDLTDLRTLQADEQGSIVSMTDASGAPLWINRYDEYGIPGTSNAGVFQYTGQFYVPWIGLYYYKARMYSPTLGRFMQTDPIGYDDQLHLYAYVGNDPINGKDPTGTRCDTSTGEGTDYCDTENPEDDGPPIVVTGPAPAAKQPSTIGTLASIFVPGYDFAACVIGGCSATDWAFAAIDIVPIGKLVSKGRKAYKAYRAFRRLCGCFAAGTMVATPTGLIAIEKIKEGDLVLAYEEATGRTTTERVTGLIRPDPKPLYDVVALDHRGRQVVFHVTDDHPWLVKSSGWVKTVDLKPSQLLVTASGKAMTVSSVTLTARVERTYNITVNRLHTFLVGKDKVVVHNGDCKRAMRFFRTNKGFRDYVHREKQRSGLAGDGAGTKNRDFNEDEIAEIFEDWIADGSPGPK